MPPTTSRTAPGFWRCTGCNTPNPSASYLTKCLGCGLPIPPYSNDQPARSPSTPAGPSPSLVERRGRFTLVAGAVFAVVILTAVGLIRWWPVDGWLVGPLLLVPRWLFLVPIVPLAVGAIRSRRWLVRAVVLADLVLVLGPGMDLAVPVARLVASPMVGSKVRVLNVDPGRWMIDGARLVGLIEKQQIDVVCFTRSVEPDGLVEPLTKSGWQFGGDHRIASRWPIAAAPAANSATPELAVVKLRHPDGFDFRLASVALPGPGRAVDCLRVGDLGGWRTELASWDEQVIQLRLNLADSGTSPVIVAGDFGRPDDCQRMISLRATYPSARQQAGWGYAGHGGDQIVASRDWSFARFGTGPDLGTDHRPVIAEAVLNPRNRAD